MVRLTTVEPGPLNSEVSYPDTFSGIGSVTLNVFYAVRGVNASNQVSAFSNRVGEFDYQVSGAGSTPPPTPTATPTPTPTATATPTPLVPPTAEPPGTPTPTPGSRAGVVSVPATIAANTTWVSGTVYLVTGQAAVNAGVTLTVQGGAVVKFQNNGATKGRLTINGVLLAQGAADAPGRLHLDPRRHGRRGYQQQRRRHVAQPRRLGRPGLQHARPAAAT